MGKFIDETGNRYGRLVVLEEAGRQNGKVLWKCQCDCGNTTIVQGNNLRAGITKSCNCLQKDRTSELLTVNEVGNVYGRLTVVEQAGTLDHTAVWTCKCECGNMVNVLGPNLRFGGTRSCGCYKREQGRKNMTGFGVKKKGWRKRPSMASYVKRAERREMGWDLSLKRFNELTETPCHYCGATPMGYHGIDRKDNDTGYIEGNVVPCCSRCNFFKRDLSYDDFLSLIGAIARHRLAN